MTAYMSVKILFISRPPSSPLPSCCTQNCVTYVESQAHKINVQYLSHSFPDFAGHFLLTNLLLDTMKKTARKSSKEGRIVNVSSEAHRYPYREGIRFDKINDPSG